jgi:glc operon protein GlcG
VTAYELQWRRWGVADARDLTMLTQKIICLDEAKQVAAAASTKARAEGWLVVIAVVDPGGHLIYLERADGTQAASAVVAQEKARTAVMFKRPTKVFEDGVLAGRVNMMTLPGATMLEGGVPLLHDGQIVGAIGVSGVTSAQDGQVAQAGVDAFAAL